MGIIAFGVDIYIIKYLFFVQKKRTGSYRSTPGKKKKLKKQCAVHKYYALRYVWSLSYAQHSFIK